LVSAPPRLSARYPLCGDRFWALAVGPFVPFDPFDTSRFVRELCQGARNDRAPAFAG
jgi:hypothetical protein